MSRPRDAARAADAQRMPAALPRGGPSRPVRQARRAGRRAARELPLDAITPNRDQPRKRFDAAALERLADSIRERGVLQPVLVRPLDGERFELIAGERRWRAAQLAGLTAIPAYVRADTDDAAALELALIENAAREDLTPVEEARTLSTLIDDLGLTQAALAKRIGRSRSDLANTLRLLDLPDDVLDLIADGRLSKGHGKSLLGLRGSGAPQRSSRAAPPSAAGRCASSSARSPRPRPATPHSKRTIDERAVDRALAHRPRRRTIDVPVEVRARGEAFTIRSPRPTAPPPSRSSRDSPRRRARPRSAGPAPAARLTPAGPRSDVISAGDVHSRRRIAARPVSIGN